MRFAVLQFPGSCDEVDALHAARAALVFDDKRLMQLRLQSVRHDARHNVGVATGGVGYNQAYRSCRVIESPCHA